MASIGEQRYRVGEQSTNDFDHEQRGGECERDAQIARWSISHVRVADTVMVRAAMLVCLT
jgi:hypothetical protein